jgi:NAD(P)-dependent dehydrogenase (short-subunit alcohol dehydrogenase family)
MPNPASPPPVALVTGGAVRIGRTITLTLAQAGYAVAVHYRSQRAQAETVVAEITAMGGAAVALAADLTDDAQTEALLSAAQHALGPVSVLVNNASTFLYDDVDTLTRDSWSAHIEPNLWAPLLLSQRFAQALPADQRGCIINLLDQRVWKLTPEFLSYTVSKMGLWALTRTLAQALAPRIRVNGVGPGPTLQNIHQSPEQFAAESAGVPLAQPVDPQEIADAVLFLVRAPSVTGQMIAVDGGQHLAWRTPDVVGHG